MTTCFCPVPRDEDAVTESSFREVMLRDDRVRQRRLLEGIYQEWRFRKCPNIRRGATHGPKARSPARSFQRKGRRQEDVYQFDPVAQQQSSHYGTPEYSRAARAAQRLATRYFFNQEHTRHSAGTKWTLKGKRSVPDRDLLRS
jgi:hypothetical protein